MPKSRSKNLPRFGSLDSLVRFFDKHDLGDYWDEMPAAKFEVNIKRRTQLIALDPELAEKLTKIARSRRTPSQRLINSWLREKLLQQG